MTSTSDDVPTAADYAALTELYQQPTKEAVVERFSRLAVDPVWVVQEARHRAFEAALQSSVNAEDAITQAALTALRDAAQHDTNTDGFIAAQPEGTQS